MVEIPDSEINVSKYQMDMFSWICLKCGKSIRHNNLATLKNSARVHIDYIHNGVYLDGSKHKRAGPKAESKDGQAPTIGLGIK